MRESIEWVDGAILYIERLSKAKIKEIESFVKEENKLSIEEEKREKVAQKELEEKVKELKITPDQVTIDKLNKDIEALKEIANGSIRRAAILTAYMAAEQSITGWDNIVDENNNSIPFTDENRSMIWPFIKSSADVMNKLYTFIGAPLGNLKAGLTLQSNTNGTKDCVDNASKAEKSA
jgi:uncharacterized protein with PIN domain